jgi:hypothetical protein
MTWLKKQLLLSLATAVVVGCGGGSTSSSKPSTGIGGENPSNYGDTNSTNGDQNNTNHGDNDNGNDDDNNENLDLSQQITEAQYSDAQAQQFDYTSYYSLKLKTDKTGNKVIRKKIITISENNVTLAEIGDDQNNPEVIPYTNDNNEIKVYENSVLVRSQKLVQTLNVDELKDKLNNEFGVNIAFSGNDKGYKFVVKEKSEDRYEYEKVIWFNQSAADKVEQYLQSQINN